METQIQDLLNSLRAIEVDVQVMPRLREIYGTTDKKISRKRPRDTEVWRDQPAKKKADDESNSEHCRRM